MIAVLGWCDDFGNDTYVTGIFKNLTEAEDWASDINDRASNEFDALRWEEFDYGGVDFDWFSANKFKKRKGEKECFLKEKKK